MTTSAIAGPRAGELWRAARVPVFLGLLVVLVAALTALSRRTPADELDPRSPAKAGSQALAVLLRERGVVVDRVSTVGRSGSGQGTPVTVLVPFPERLGPSGMADVEALGPAQLVLVDPPEDVLSRLAPGVRRAGGGPTGAREPGCQLPEARRAGVADTGGSTYEAAAGAVVSSCYATGGAGSLVTAGTGPAGRTVTILGSGTALTNARLGERGNAALGLGLLGRTDRLLWLLPPRGVALRPAQGTDRPASLRSLLPSRVSLAVVQLGLAVVLIALWRGRRLGPVVHEPLPVVVRAAETVEGRGRLYRAARSREQPARALRSAALGRLTPVLGLPLDAAPAAVVAAAAGRSDRPPTAVAALLYGAPPGSDAALVALADALDALDREVRRS